MTRPMPQPPANPPNQFHTDTLLSGAAVGSAGIRTAAIGRPQSPQKRAALRFAKEHDGQLTAVKPGQPIKFRAHATVSRAVISPSRA